MPYLLNLVYLLLLIVVSPWLLFKAIRQGKYRQGHAEKLFGSVPLRQGSGRCVWLHGVSVGEVRLLRTLVAELGRRRPDLQFAISTTTATGFALAKTLYPNCSVFYCPLDFSWAVRRAVCRVRPDLLVLAELELWPNLIRAAHQQGTKVAIINGRLGENSFRGYLRIRWLVSRILEKIDLVAVQDEVIAGRFRALGMPEAKLHVTGSLKYDGAEMDGDNPATAGLRQLAGFQPDDIVLVAGSTHDPEEAHLLDAYQQLAAQEPRLRLVLVPRHPHRFDHVARLLTRAQVRFLRRTQLDRPRVDREARVLLVDVVGELGAWWGAADLAYVGGSLTNRGGQNMIEPAAYGAAIAVGPNTWNFRDIMAGLLAADAVVVVGNGAQLLAFLRRCLDEPRYAEMLGRRAQDLVKKQQGATGRTVDGIERLLDSPSAAAGRAQQAA